MYLELNDENGNFVMEAFYSDQDHKMTFTANLTEFPLELVEAFIAQARTRLPPADRVTQISN